MYAVVKLQGFQYKVSPGDRLEVPRGPWEVGQELELSDVLLVSDESGVSVGTPTVPGAKVKASVVRHFRGPKVLVGKFKRREDYRRLKGHRDDLTELEILGIERE